MADNSDNGGLYFIVGALVVAVGLMGYFYYNGSLGSSAGPSTIVEKTVVNPVEKPADFHIDINKH